jgi:hypothetical protein
MKNLLKYMVVLFVAILSSCSPNEEYEEYTITKSSVIDMAALEGGGGVSAAGPDLPGTAD